MKLLHNQEIGFSTVLSDKILANNLDQLLKVINDYKVFVFSEFRQFFWKSSILPKTSVKINKNFNKKTIQKNPIRKLMICLMCMYVCGVKERKHLKHLFFDFTQQLPPRLAPPRLELVRLLYSEISNFKTLQLEFQKARKFHIFHE